MSHARFVKNLNTIYNEVTLYSEFKELGRLSLMLSTFEWEKDFRYVVPMFLLNGFNYAYFVRNDLTKPDLRDILDTIFIQTRRVVSTIQLSIKNLKECTSINKCAYPAIDITRFCKELLFLPECILSNVYAYKVSSEFYYQDRPLFNYSGPLYIETKRIEQENKCVWSALAILDRKIASINCAIEYYVYTRTFPIEGKLVKHHTISNGMYYSPSLKALRDSIRLLDPKLLGFNISQYESLPLSIKKGYHSYITANFLEIRKYVKKKDMRYLLAWKTGRFCATL